MGLANIKGVFEGKDFKLMDFGKDSEANYEKAFKEGFHYNRAIYDYYKNNIIRNNIYFQDGFLADEEKEKIGKAFVDGIVYNCLLTVYVD